MSNKIDLLSAPHGSQHQAGSFDELNVTDLKGELSDPQPAKNHAESHRPNSTDELNVTGLRGLLADPQSPAAHSHQEIENKIAFLYSETATTTEVTISSIPRVLPTYSSAFVIATGVKVHPLSGNTTPAFVHAVITGDIIQFTIWDNTGVIYPTAPNWEDYVFQIAYTLIIVP